MTVLLCVVCLTCCLFLWSANPVHGVLTLVVVGLSFAAGLLTVGLEFSALIVLLVYVGAVTVLFVFVVMMVNLRATPGSYITPEGPAVWVALVGVLWWAAPAATALTPVGHLPPPLTQQLNLPSLGYLLYATPWVTAVATVGGILFIAMVSAICLSLVTSENYRSQEFYSQIRKSNAVFVLHD